MKNNRNIIKDSFYGDMPILEEKNMNKKIAKVLTVTMCLLSVFATFTVNTVTVSAEEPAALVEEIPTEAKIPTAGITAVIYNEMSNLQNYTVDVKNDVTLVQTEAASDIVTIEDEETALASTFYVIPVSADEVYFMEQIVAAETYSYWGVDECLPIAQVIVNRYYSSEFPDDISEILSQKNQFETYSNGRYKDVEITDAVKEAVNLALSGKGTLPKESVFFCTEEYYNKIGKNGWFGTLTKVDQVENTLFFM